MKKLSALLLAIASLICICFGFTACNLIDDILGDKDVTVQGNTNNSDDNKTETKPASEGLEFTLINNGKNYALTGIGTCKDKEVVIPSSYNNKPVVQIGEYAYVTTEDVTNLTDDEWDFEDYILFGDSEATSVIIPNSVTLIGSLAFSESKITSITIPASVKKIGYEAFALCNSLKNVTLNKGLEVIGVGAFRECSNLKSFTVPASVKNIQIYAFLSCDKLNTLTVDAGNTVYRSSENCLINIAKGILIAGCKSSVIPSDGSVKVIGESAFDSCDGLTSINIPVSVTYMEDCAFGSCADLTTITYEGTVEQWKKLLNNLDDNWYWHDGSVNFTVHCTNGELDCMGQVIK